MTIEGPLTHTLEAFKKIAECCFRRSRRAVVSIALIVIVIVDLIPGRTAGLIVRRRHLSAVAVSGVCCTAQVAERESRIVHALSARLR